MSKRPADFPAQAIISPLCEALTQHNVIVGAPPGAGKSTVLPLALLQAFPDKKILLMQPRRVVVRNLAGFLASQLKESVGQTVGYRIRGESKVSQHTRLEVITEGILARRIQQDPELADTAIIIFDEFHERSIHSDFGLALALEVQQGLREDLRLIVMSATLDTGALRTLLPEAEVLQTSGRMFDVQTRYTGQIQAEKLHEVVANATFDVLQQVDGDVLVFLPGAGAIRKVDQLLQPRLSGQPVIVHQLFGAVDKAAQQQALQPDEQGRQKVILATNIAETSLTIENIEAVVDSGQENQAEFHPGSGLSQLTTQMISQASATQRLGRAGRQGPGICIRLWAKEQHERLARHSTPQILREDISGLMLEALSWGSGLDQLALLDVPGPAQQQSARELLQRIGALSVDDGKVSVTPYGRRLSAFPCHPRLAHMLMHIQDNAPHFVGEAAVIAALAEESGSVQQTWVKEALTSMGGPQWQRITRQARRYLSLLGTGSDVPQPAALKDDGLGLAIAVAYTDHIAFARDGAQWKMVNGKRAELNGGAARYEWIAVLQAQQLGSQIKIRLAQPLNLALLQQWFGDKFYQQQQVDYSATDKQMRARHVSGFGNIIISSEPVSGMSRKDIGHAWLTYLRQQDAGSLKLEPDTRQWLNRLALAARLNLSQPQAFDEAPAWPDVQHLFKHFDDNLLIPLLAGLKTLEEVQTIRWAKVLHPSLPWSQQHALDLYLPPRIKVPSGLSHKLDYQNDGQVVLPVRMQEMYGENTILTVADDQVTVVFSLLSPAGRPVQMTRDIPAFWQGSYHEVKKEMKGRYPKHYWPEDPTTAMPTTKTKKAMD